MSNYYYRSKSDISQKSNSINSHRSSYSHSSYSKRSTGSTKSTKHTIEFDPIGEVLNSKYVLISELGSGSFATVWLAYNMDNKKYYAIKIQDSDQIDIGIEEAKLFNRFKNESSPYINKIIDTFYHKMEYGNHICMVLELMAGSLYDIMKVGRYSKGFPLHITKIILYQLLTAVSILNNKYNLVHTDLKVENILVKGINIKTKEIIEQFNSNKRLMFLLSHYNKNKSNNDAEIKNLMKSINFDDIEEKYDENKNIEIINDIIPDNLEIRLSDFGNCRDINDLSFHIQTRYYRAPEVILEYKFNENCDIWSIGCIVYELLSGNTLFDPDKKAKMSVDQDHLYNIISLLGKIPTELVDKSKKRNVFFKENGLLKGIYNINYKPLNIFLKEKLSSLSQHELVLLEHFMQNCLKYDSFSRMSAKDALKHKIFNSIKNINMFKQNLKTV